MQIQSIDGQECGAHKAQRCIAVSDPGGQESGAHKGHNGHASGIVPTIEMLWRRRRFAIHQIIRADNALGAFLRSEHGWTKDAPETDRKRIEAIARAFVKHGELVGAGKPGLAPPGWDEYAEIVLASITTRAPFANQRKTIEKEITRLVRLLPVWEAWGKDVRGFGEMSLGAILGEAGDLSNYPEFGEDTADRATAALWKRMGVAVMEGIAQGKLRKTATAESWIMHGYNRERRSVMWNIGEAFVKAGGPYGDLYRHRKAVEHAAAKKRGLIPASTTKATVEAWRAAGLPDLVRVPKIADDHISAGHIAARAHRYIEKRLLRDLMRAWRGTILRLHVSARNGVSSANTLG